MQTDKVQHSRFELKYFIDESTALRVRDFVQSYLEIDEFGAQRPSLSYPTLSLYLDSDDLKTYWHTINGDKNRFKLRLRYYDDRPETPVFFEIKRRMNNIILKDRAGVRKAAVRRLLAGHLPERGDLLYPGDIQQQAAAARFIELMSRLQAKPKMHIAYLREAWENPMDNSVRVTFDRVVDSAPNPQPTLVATSPNPHRVFEKSVVLELKYTNRFPNWFRELVSTFDCMQTGAAKFAEGIFMKGEDWVHRACQPKPPEVVVDEFLAGREFFGQGMPGPIPTRR